VYQFLYFIPFHVIIIITIIVVIIIIAGKWALAGVGGRKRQGKGMEFDYVFSLKVISVYSGFES
jgi:hypothetical protein